jgi:hypothetical protein
MVTPAVSSTRAGILRPTVIDGAFRPRTPGLSPYSLSCALQSDGKIILAGQSSGDPAVSVISRINADGAADASFTLDPAFTNPAAANQASSINETRTPA